MNNVRKLIAILLMATLILMSSMTAFAANQGKGDAIQDRDRQRLQDQTCVVATIDTSNGDCTQDMVRTRDRIRTRDRLRLMVQFIEQD